VCIEKFADFPQMGRFTLRDEGTVKIPVILNLKNEKKLSKKVVSPQMLH